jgi:hypothetical protein
LGPDKSIQLIISILHSWTKTCEGKLLILFTHKSQIRLILWLDDNIKYQNDNFVRLILWLDDNIKYQNA